MLWLSVTYRKAAVGQELPERRLYKAKKWISCVCMASKETSITELIHSKYIPKYIYTHNTVFYCAYMCAILEHA